jgi:hypothetical protein
VRELSSGTRFGVTFEIEEGSSLIWLEQELIVSTNSGVKKISFDNFRKFLRTGDDFKTVDYPIGTIMNKTSSREVETYIESKVISEKPINEITINGIKLIVNSKEVTLPEMKFTKQSGLFLHPLNC